MRYSKDHKQETRQRIVEAAGRRFKQDGIDGAGIATVMSDAARLPAPNSLVNSRGSQSLKKRAGVMSRGGRFGVGCIVLLYCGGSLFSGALSSVHSTRMCWRTPSCSVC